METLSLACRYKALLILALCSLLISCVPTIDVGEVAGSDGPRAGTVGDTGYGGDQLAVLGGTMTGGTSSRTTCNLGESIGLCEICGPNNDRVSVMNDPNCPEVDCNTLKSHRIVSDEEGRLECRLQEFRPGDSNCQGPQTCITDPRLYCESQVEMTILSKEEVGECNTLEGCNDGTPPMLVPRPGETCAEGLGTCTEAGECDVIASCLTLFNYRYNNSNQLCGDQLATQNTCDFYLAATDNPWGTETISCTQFCNENGGSCIQAWGDSDDGCDRAGDQNCGDTFGDSICRCRAPEP